MRFLKRKGLGGCPASPITLHGHRRPRLYRERILIPREIPCKRKCASIILLLNIPGGCGGRAPAHAATCRIFCVTFGGCGLQVSFWMISRPVRFYSFFLVLFC